MSLILNIFNTELDVMELFPELAVRSLVERDSKVNINLTEKTVWNESKVTRE